MANTKVSTVYDIPAGTQLGEGTGITVGGKVTVETTYDSSGRLITSGDGAPAVTSSQLTTASTTAGYADANATFNDVSSLSSKDFLGASVSITPGGAISLSLSQTNLTKGDTSTNFDTLSLKFTDKNILTPGAEDGSINRVRITESFNVVNHRGNAADGSHDDASGRATVYADATAIPCYARGTLISTTRGEVAVEKLRVGDMLHTANGGSSAVVWLGHRHVDCNRQLNKEEAYPIRVSKDAFGPGLPKRDLWLSPKHAVFVNEALVPIQCLINGTTITQDIKPRVSYYHIELTEHNVIFAEGMPAESFLDTAPNTGESRDFFSVRLGEVHVMDEQMPLERSNPEWRDIFAEKGYAPLVDGGEKLKAIQDSIANQTCSVVSQLSLQVAA
jgi:hypothetical protein